jgi:hypothetical protein
VLWSAAVVVCVFVGLQTLAPAVRVWLGHAYLVMGYWIPALMIPTAARAFTARVGGPQGSAPLVSGAFEAWLAHTDTWWRLHPITAPNWLLYMLELSYLLGYVLVPAAFTFIWTNGTATDTDRFWTAVLTSGFACYSSLPWLVSRPPRARLPPSLLRSFGGPRKPDTTIEGKPDVPIEGGAASAGLRAANEFVLARVSHGLNTFPSGHVAVSVAAALEVMSISRPAGLATLVVAALIAAGAVAGRYHYAVDVASGSVVGIAASALV